jgi:hypothetical protein
MATQPPHVGTIGEKIRIGHGIWINCMNQECLHRAKVDLAALAERYGADLPVAELVARRVQRVRKPLTAPVDHGCGRERAAGNPRWAP